MKEHQDLLIDIGNGFPIKLISVRMVKVRDEYLPDINHVNLKLNLIKELSVKSNYLTGKELKFIRLSLELTMNEFKKLLGLNESFDYNYIEQNNLSLNWEVETLLRQYLFNRFNNPKFFNNNSTICIDCEKD